MIRAQDNYPSRSDLQLLRSVAVQWRANKLPEPGRPAQGMSVEQTTFLHRPPESIWSVHEKAVAERPKSKAGRPR